MKHWHLSWQKLNLMTFLVKYVQLDLGRFWLNQNIISFALNYPHFRVVWSPVTQWQMHHEFDDKGPVTCYCLSTASYCAANNILMADPRCENWPQSQTCIKCQSSDWLSRDILASDWVTGVIKYQCRTLIITFLPGLNIITCLHLSHQDHSNIGSLILANRCLLALLHHNTISTFLWLPWPWCFVWPSYDHSSSCDDVIWCEWVINIPGDIGWH